ncbi:hypothetical protein [Asticcacaulis benevestitus]|uniref:Uncharacterized protein n=1 Tax=Asticcacaulis benevestitus DSM 16100 = ATCC BAA-896 TaxID=1121022 RepID=V4PXE1_9CAUL|nr:hypothetical protein [Asticcacaulis benevestitus]ESQ90250.1 hypothetical protein ABENE_12795 [Asticcacaulis benevestitus DSM 16100 = ATCC BAA-896]
MEKHFYDLPVYRLSEEKYYELANQELDARDQKQQAILAPHPVPDSYRSRIEQHRYDKYGPWRFNEILGYIRLFFLGSQIRGEYFSAEKQQNRLSRSGKVFTYRTLKLAPEITIYPLDAMSDADIYAAVQAYISDCKKELTRERVIDDSLLEAIAPFVKWRELILGLGE